jgi:hypothetical protein
MAKHELWSVPKDECTDIYLLLLRKDYDALIRLEHDRIRDTANASMKLYDIDLNYADVHHYALVGYYYSCLYWEDGMDFETLSTFWMRMYIFQQVYVETYLTKLDICDRFRIAKLYDKVVKNMDLKSCRNYFEAIYTAADKVNMLTDTAVELMYMLLEQTCKKSGSDEELEQTLIPMYKWDGDMKTVPIAPLLLSMEAMLHHQKQTELNMPFMAIGEQFENLIGG